MKHDPYLSRKKLFVRTSSNTTTTTIYEQCDHKLHGTYRLTSCPWVRCANCYTPLYKIYLRGGISNDSNN